MSKAFGQALLDDMASTPSLSMTRVRQAAREILAVIREGLIRDRVVKISNFGTFRLNPVAPRRGFNPKTKEPITIPAHYRVLFSPCKELRELIQPDRQPLVPIAPEQNPAPPMPEPAVASEPEVAPEPAVEPIPVPELGSGPAPAPAKMAEPAPEPTAMPPKTRTSRRLPSRSRKHYYLGAAMALIIILAGARLLLDSGPESTTGPGAENTAPATFIVAMPVIESPPPVSIEPTPVVAPEEPAWAPIEAESAPVVVSQASSYFFSEQTHEVVRGDNLWRLAGHHYRNPLLWPHIYQANIPAIQDPDLLPTGSIITIPGLEGSPARLTATDRRNIAEGYYLTYQHYKKSGRRDAFHALQEAQRYDHEVVEKHLDRTTPAEASELQLARQFF